MGSQLCIAGSRQHELKSFGRFWYREVRDLTRLNDFGLLDLTRLNELCLTSSFD